MGRGNNPGTIRIPFNVFSILVFLGVPRKCVSFQILVPGQRQRSNRLCESVPRNALVVTRGIAHYKPTYQDIASFLARCDSLSSECPSNTRIREPGVLSA